MENIDKLELLVKQVRNELPVTQCPALLNWTIESAICTLRCGLALSQDDYAKARWQIAMAMKERGKYADKTR